MDNYYISISFHNKELYVSMAETSDPPRGVKAFTMQHSVINGSSSASIVVEKSNLKDGISKCEIGLIDKLKKNIGGLQDQMNKLRKSTLIDDLIKK